MINWRPYQTEIIESVFDGWKTYTDQIVVAATGAGKAQPLDAGILTPSGWTTMIDVKVGDAVVGSDGESHNVLGVFPQGRKDVYKIIFDDGSIVECCNDHLWSVQTKSHKCRGNGFITMSTKDIREGGLKDGSGANKWFVPVVSPIKFKSIPVPVDPYVLGALIGDGQLKAEQVSRRAGVTARVFKDRETKPLTQYDIRISSQDSFVIETISDKLDGVATLKYLGGYDYHVQGGGRRGPHKSPLNSALCSLGLMGKHSWDKFIPDIYKYNSVSVRLGVLRGLMDTDGTVQNNGKAPDFCTVSFRLAHDVCEIVRSLGGCTKVRTKAAGTYTHKGEKRTGKKSYRVTVSIPDCPFLLPRKANLYNFTPKQGRTKAIVGIDRVGEKECQCILVDSSDHLYVTDGYTLTHNTNILWGIADRFMTENPGSRVMVVAHRKELIDQPKARLEQFWPQRANQVGIVMADSNECHRPITIATVQTVGQKSGKRVADILAFGKIDLLIIDECHHAASKSYRNFIDALKVANPRMKHLGVTATPERADFKSLAEIYQHEAANVGVLRLIDEGHLCEPKVHGVKTNIDLSWVSSNGTGGNRDYNQKQLVAAVETSDCFKVVLKTHTEKVGDRPTIAFVPSVKGAYQLADMLKAEGIAAIAADGTTPKAEREQLLQDFKAGKYTTIVNVALWTEGLDLPHLECCHLVRPTKSDALYLQMVGRVLRTFKGKTHADIFDYQPLGERNLEQRLVKLKKKKKRKSPFAGMGGGNGSSAEGPMIRSGDLVEYVMLDYFKKRKEAWIDVNGWRLIGMGKGTDNIERSMAISPDGNELWAIWREEGQRWNQARRFMTGDFDTITARAEEMTKKHGSDSLMRKKAPWRKGPPSEKMRKFGENLRVYQSGMNAGQLSDAINQKLVMQAIQRSADMKVAA